MLPRLTPPLFDDVQHCSRDELIRQILARNESSTFHFSEKWLRKQRVSRLRELARSTQEVFNDAEEMHAAEQIS